MFRKRHMLKLSGGIAIAASLAVIAVPSALGAHKDGPACQSGPAGWISVTDDQGVPYLEPVGQTACAAPLACTSAADAATSSPYPGWVSVTDDLGIPWLYQVSLSASADREACTPAPAAPAAAPTTGQPAAVPTGPIMQSPYPGWVIVTDENGVPYLEPIAQAGA
jgi:hypothetical protein